MSYNPAEAPRPPFVTFLKRAVEDREASLKTGHYTTKDVDFAVITPHGSKDRIERVATEWLESQKAAAREGRIPGDWPSAFARMYEAWKTNEELPENGTSVKNWPVLSPSQLQLCLQYGYRTVEDLAVMNEEGMARLGMGGRDIKRLAQDYLASSDKSKASQDLETLREANNSLQVRLDSMSAQIEALMKLVPDDKLKSMQAVVTPKTETLREI